MTEPRPLGPVRRLLHGRYLTPAVLVVNGVLTALVGVLPFSDAGIRGLDAILAVVLLGTGLLIARVIDAFVLAAARPRTVVELPRTRRRRVAHRTSTTGD